MAKAPKLDEGMFWKNGKISYTYRNTLTNHSAEKSTGKDNLEDARIERATFLNSLTWRAKTGAGMTWDQVMHHYVERLKAKGARHERAEEEYFQCQHRLGSMRVADSQEALDAWVLDALDGKPGARQFKTQARRKNPHEDTINVVIKRLRAAVRLMITLKKFPKQLEPDWPMSKGVQKFAARPSTKLKVTYDQVQVMLKIARDIYLRGEVRVNADGSPRLSITARLILIICWGGAQRVKRVGRLQHSNFFEQDGMLFLDCADVEGVKNYDNKRGQVNPITSFQMKVEVARMLREALPGNPWLFDKPLRADDVRWYLSKASKQVKGLEVAIGAHVLRRAAGSHFGKRTSSTNGSSVLGNTPQVFDEKYNLVDLENQIEAQQTLPEPQADPAQEKPADPAGVVVPLKRG